MSLTLVTGGTLLPAVAPGQVVHVSRRVVLPSSRVVPKGRYEVLDVDGARVLVGVSLDCSALSAQMQGFAGLPTRIWLLEGQYTAFANGGDGPAFIPDTAPRA